jgi:hypothetical protein
LFLFAIYVGGWIKPVAKPESDHSAAYIGKIPGEISFKVKGQPVNASEVVRREEGIRVREFEGDCAA